MQYISRRNLLIWELSKLRNRQKLELQEQKLLERWAQMEQVILTWAVVDLIWLPL